MDLNVLNRVRYTILVGDYFISKIYFYLVWFKLPKIFFLVCHLSSLNKYMSL